MGEGEYLASIHKGYNFKIMNRDKKILLVIFLCSLSSLAYEIALMRIFSVSLWYHFAFMIVSIAMLGIGTSGTVLSLYPKLRNLSNIGIYGLLLGTGISTSYILSNHIPFDPVKLSWSKLQLLYIGIYYIILSIPFFFAGLIIATAFSCIGERASLLYGADLLGAGIGSIGILYFVAIMGPDRAVFLLSCIALFASFVISSKKLKIISSILILVNFSLLLFHPKFIDLRMSPYKGLEVALRYPGAEHLKTYFSPFSRMDAFKSPAVRFAPGISLRYIDALPEQIGFSIDGGEINAITNVHNGEFLRFLTYLPSALVYEIGNTSNTPHTPFRKRENPQSPFSNPPTPPFRKGGQGGFEDVLILEPKGGIQALVAGYHGAENIYKVESNPLIVKVIRDEFGDFSGEIYKDKTWSGLGRSRLKSMKKQFDIIDISLMGTTPSGSFGISEDYRFTIEAFKEYFRYLKPEGFISINLFIIPPPRTELRLTNTILKTMEELGVKDREKHLAALRSWGSICILAKKSPLTLKEIEAFKRFAEEKRFDFIYYPGIKEVETNTFIQTPSNEYFRAFQNIINPETHASFTQNYIFDIRHVSDDRPFFHYYLRFENIREIYKIMGGKWQYFVEEGFILPAVFIQVLILSLILILLPAISKEKAKVKVEGKEGQNLNLNLGLSLLPYFALLGIGFMFVEISFIHRIILPLENPSYAFAAVLTSILISSGIGSLLSYRISFLRSSYVAVAISFLIILYSILLPFFSDIISPYSILLKIISVFFILMPIGLLMGIPFPLGLTILSERNKILIPWAWAINGCFSVLAPILTMMLAMATGFKFVLWVGALSYGMAFITLKRFLKS